MCISHFSETVSNYFPTIVWKRFAYYASDNHIHICTNWMMTFSKDDSKQKLLIPTWAWIINLQCVNLFPLFSSSNHPFIMQMRYVLFNHNKNNRNPSSDYLVFIIIIVCKQYNFQIRKPNTRYRMLKLCQLILYTIKV